MSGISPVSRCTTLVEAFFNDTSLGTSTGFFYKNEEKNYLVTNWHVITGRHPVTGEHLRPDAGEPNRLSIFQHRTDGNLQESFLPLQKDDSFLWFQHRRYGSGVDVAVLPIEPDERFIVHPINDLDNTPPNEFGPMVGKEVFVLGCPFGQFAFYLSGYPIWKRASIATELDYNIENLPMFLVDTATRKGMSGSPVVYIVGEFQQFMGVYSGRIGANDFDDVQLGRVWRARLVPEIINEGVSGDREPTQATI